MAKKSNNKSRRYEAVFIKKSPVTARAGKMVYIRKDFHETIYRLCSILNEKGISLSGYIDNVLAHHFEVHGDEITRLYNEKIQGINIIKKTQT